MVRLVVYWGALAGGWWLGVGVRCAHPNLAEYLTS